MPDAKPYEDSVVEELDRKRSCHAPYRYEYGADLHNERERIGLGLFDDLHIG